MRKDRARAWASISFTKLKTLFSHNTDERASGGDGGSGAGFLEALKEV